MEERGQLPVPLPYANPTKSYWQTPPSDIADLRSTVELPQEADYVVIGSGVSGACIAYGILERQPGATVVMLEARQACSGATGRNGGHLKPASYREFLSNSRKHGVDEAIRIAKLEFSNRQHTIDFVQKHNISCDIHPCPTVDIIYEAPQWTAGVKAINAMRKALPNGGTETYEIVEQEEARRRYLTPQALGAFEYEAGSIQPYQFTTGILRLALARGLNLQTATPATALTSSISTSSPGGANKKLWTVSTPRGTIRTRTPILATNGYTAHLLPPLQSLLVPLRGQMSVQRPGSALPAAGCLRTTYSFIYGNGYEYMITRPAGCNWGVAGDMCWSAVCGGCWVDGGRGAEGVGGRVGVCRVQRPWYESLLQCRSGLVVDDDGGSSGNTSLGRLVSKSVSNGTREDGDEISGEAAYDGGGARSGAGSEKLTRG